MSKYYKDTSSFKPDTLPGMAKEESGWQQQEPPREKQPFHQEVALSKKIEDKAKDVELSARNDDDSVKNDQNPPPPPPSDLPGDELPESNSDNFITLEEAQLEIDQAYLRGVEEGKAKVEDDFLAASRSLLNLCQELDKLRETLIGNSSRELQDFALAIVERILRFSVEEQDHTIIATIEEALARAVRSDEFTIYIHPEDYEVVKMKSGDIIAGISGLNNIVLKKDITIARGGAKLESENCTIDASIASQFDVIREEIRKRL